MSSTTLDAGHATVGVSIDQRLITPLTHARDISRLLLDTVPAYGILSARAGFDVELDDIHALVRARDLVNDLTVVLGWCRTNLHKLPFAVPVGDVPTVLRGVNRACELAREHALARQVDPPRARSHASALADVLDSLVAISRTWDLATLAVASAAQPELADDAYREGVATALVTYAGGRVAAAAAGVLPTEYRARYDEEFRAELYALAQAGASRWRQILHAARLFDRAFELRAELRLAMKRGRKA